MRLLHLFAACCELLLVCLVPSEPLPPGEGDKDALLWAQTGVPMPADMQFYKLPRVSQRLVIINDTQSNGIYRSDYKGQAVKGENTNAKLIWSAPGGLQWSPRDQWRNATAVYLPDAVTVTREWTDVWNGSNYQKNTVVRWTFPDGTIFADLLIRRLEGEEWPFELRIREKKAGKWESTAYRPWSDADSLPAGSVRKRFAVSALDDEIPGRFVEAWVLPPAFAAGKFKPSRLPVTANEREDGWTPKHYVGNLVSCASCHDRAGESGKYAGVNAPGSDGVISWHPYTMETVNTDAYPRFDTKRWPLKMR